MGLAAGDKQVPFGFAQGKLSPPAAVRNDSFFFQPETTHPPKSVISASQTARDSVLW
jgi:hypothetical protein